MASAGDQIFISYRRSDTEGYAGRLEDTLREYFGKERVFRDIGGIAPGEDFRQKSEETAEGAGALIVLIGPNWLSSQDGGKPRLHEPGDLVATEIKAALDKERVIVPVLVQGAIMPREKDLPEALKALARRNAVSVSDANWVSDTTRLAKVLAIDVRSAVERKLDWLRLSVISLLVAPMVLSLAMIAYPEFRKQAIRTPDNRTTYVPRPNVKAADWQKFRQKIWDELELELSDSELADFQKKLEALYGGKDKDETPPLKDTLANWLTVIRPFENDLTNTVRKIDAIFDGLVSCCAWTVKDQKKAKTQAISAVNPFGIFLVALLLGLTRTWIDPSRRKYIWAAIAVGCLGVTITFFYYLRNVDEGFPFLPSDEYFAFVATSIIIAIMLGLLALSGFKPNDSIR